MKFLIGELLVLDPAQVTVNLPEDDVPAYSATATYNVADEVIWNHRVYGCLIDGTVGKSPALFADEARYGRVQHWQLRGPTNAWACVDGELAAATVADSPIVVTISGLSGPQVVGLIDASGTLVTVRFLDAAGGQIDSREFNVSGFDYSSHHAFLFTVPVPAKTNILIRDVPVATSRMQVIVAGEKTALSEICIAASIVNIGAALMGSQIGIRSRSIYEDDQFGSPRFVYRPSRINASYDVHGSRGYIDAIWPRFKALSGRRVIYQADERVMTIGAGLVRDVTMPIVVPDDYLFSMEIEGLQ